MIDDLRHAREPDSFQILEESEAAAIFWVGLIACLVVFG